MRKPILALLGILSVLILVLVIWNTGGIERLDSPYLDEAGNVRSTFLAGEGDPRSAEGPRIEVDRPRSTSADEPSAIAGWRYYVLRLRQLPTAADRKRELAVRAHAIRALDPTTLAALAIDDPGALSYETRIGDLTRQTPMIHCLLKHWTALAARQGEDLRAEFVRVWDRESAPGLHAADPGMIELACTGLTYLWGEADVQFYLPSVVQSLQALTPGREIDRALVRFPLRLVSSACSRFPWARPDGLALLSAAWMIQPLRMAFLAQMVVGTRYLEWAGPLQALLLDGDTGKQWAAVEALRYFVDGHGLEPGQMVALVSPAMLGSKDATLRNAAIELLAEYGGVAGRDRLVQLLFDRGFPFRGGVLSFLAIKGKAPIEVCFAFLTDQEEALRNTALYALGHMSKVSDEAFARICREATENPDPAARRMALVGLGRSGRDIMALLDASLEDPDASVQSEAVRQIGLQEVPQVPRLLAVATNHDLDRGVREVAFKELLLDAPDHMVAEVCGRMRADPDESISAAGYLLQATVALGTDDDRAIAAWEKLEIPSSVLRQHEALRDSADGTLGEVLKAVAGGGIRKEIAERIRFGLERILDPRNQAILDDQDLFLALGAGKESSLLARMNAEQRRVLRFLRGQRRGPK